MKNIAKYIKENSEIIVCAIIIILIIIVFAFAFKAETNNRSVYKEVETKIENGYNVYVNGMEIESDKIVIDKYPSDSYTIDDSKEVIMITLV